MLLRLFPTLRTGERVLIPRLYSTNSKKTPKTTRAVNIQKLRRTNRLTNQSQTLRTLLEQHPELVVKPCTTFTTCENYDLDKILEKKNHFLQVLIPNEILHFKYKDEHDILIMENGSMVGWGIDEQTFESKILPLFQDAEISKCQYPESEDMDYIETEILGEDSHIIEETLIVNSSNKEQVLLDKAAFSSGLSRSTRLAILENALERHIDQTKKITENLSVGKKLTVTETELLRLTGRLFLLRGKLNLYSELIEVPDLYWTEPTLERIYKLTSNVLDISPRISILNKKLDYATDESRALLSTLNEQKSTRLEWIIIYLILIEVCFEIFHFYERYSDHEVEVETEKKI